MEGNGAPAAVAARLGRSDCEGARGEGRGEAKPCPKGRDPSKERREGEHQCAPRQPGEQGGKPSPLQPARATPFKETTPLKKNRRRLT